MIFLAFFGNLAGPDLLIILIIVLVLFGAKKLPELAKGMGQAIREFQKAKDETPADSAAKSEVAATPAAAVPTVPRIENAPANGATRSETSQPVAPGTKAS